MRCRFPSTRDRLLPGALLWLPVAIGVVLLSAACSGSTPRVSDEAIAKIAETADSAADAAGAAVDAAGAVADAAGTIRETTRSLRQVERRARAKQREMVELEQQFVTLLHAGEKKPLRKKAAQVRDAYLELAEVTDDYRSALRKRLGKEASRGLLAPYKKQTRGLRLAARGLDEYRKALKLGDLELAKVGLEKMTRGEALMKTAGEDLALATGADATAAQLY